MPRPIAVTIDTRDLDRAIEELRERMAEDKVLSLFAEQARLLANEMRARVPVRTGLLRSAIFSRRGRKGESPYAIAGVSGKKAPHAHLVEFGTVKMSARPFWRPATEALGPVIVRNIESGLRDAIQELNSRA